MDRRGFTFIELIISMVLVSILGVFLSGILSRAVQSYTAVSSRGAIGAGLAAVFDTLNFDATSVVPNTTRILTSGSGATQVYAVEFINALYTLPYRVNAGQSTNSANGTFTQWTGNSGGYVGNGYTITLNNTACTAFSGAAPCGFNVMGSLSYADTAVVNYTYPYSYSWTNYTQMTNWSLAVIPSGGGTGIYNPSSSAVKTSFFVGCGQYGSTGPANCPVYYTSYAGETWLSYLYTANHGTGFPSASPSNITFIIDFTKTPVSYVCTPNTSSTGAGTGTLKKYWGYTRTTTQTVSPGGSSAIVVQGVSACSFSVDNTATPTLLSIYVQLTDALGESGTLVQEVRLNTNY